MALTDVSSPAISRWAEVLGPSFVIDDDKTLRRAETATFRTTQKIPVILRPGTVEQVQDAVRIANEYGTALYPISSGKNWGYGSGVPASTDCAILDLSRLNEIIDFNEQLGYVTVQPGVTQAGLFAFLQQRKSGLWMDATGSSPECSLIG